MIKRIYHKLWWYYHMLKVLPFKLKLRRKIIKHFEASETRLTDEQQTVIEFFLKHNTLCTFPYSFVNQFKTKNIEVCFDCETVLKYVMRKNVYILNVIGVTTGLSGLMPCFVANNIPILRIAI